MESRSENLPVTLLFSHRNGISTARVITEALVLFDAVIDKVADDETKERITACAGDLYDMLRTVR